MHDTLFFKNQIAYQVVNPLGEVIDRGSLWNATAGRLKDQILRGLTVADGANPGTLTSVQDIWFRADGSTILGSLEQWIQGTAYSTRYNNSTYVTSVGFNGTFAATANVTIKAVVLADRNGRSLPTSFLVGSMMMFYSTSLNLSVGSAGNVVIQWTVTHS